MPLPQGRLVVTCQQVKAGDPSSVLSTGEPTPVDPCPVLGSLGQERDRHSVESPMKGYKDDEGTGASLL